MTETHMQEAVKRINEARELGWTELDLSCLEIQEIPEELLELAQILCDLYLSDTDISDLSPLANLTKLERLYLGYTKASDLSPLANLTSLECLSFWRTNVSDISPLAHLTSLKRIDLLNCPLVKSSENIQALKKLSENGCKIYGVEEFMK